MNLACDTTTHIQKQQRVCLGVAKPMGLGTQPHCARRRGGERNPRSQYARLGGVPLFPTRHPCPWLALGCMSQASTAHLHSVQGMGAFPGETELGLRKDWLLLNLAGQGLTSYTASSGIRVSEGHLPFPGAPSLSLRGSLLSRKEEQMMMC